MRNLLLIIGIALAVAGGVITYRALYVEPRSAVVITETEVRQLPNHGRVVSGALLLLGGTAAALYAALRMKR